VECPWWLLEEIHGAVQEGFRRLNRGGIDVGGVLFGWPSDELIRIHAWRPIACEYAMGPSLQLSNADRQALEQLLEDAERDPLLKVLEPVGWFVSHPRHGLCLTETDVQLFDSFFPGNRQVTLVLHPQKMAPTRAAFFLRDEEGKIGRENPPRDFVVEGIAFPSAQPESPTRPVSPLAIADGAEMREAQENLTPPAFGEVATAKPRYWTWGALALVLTAAGYALVERPNLLPLTLRAEEETLGMRIQDVNGQLRIEWNRESAAARSAGRGTLFVHDGRNLPPIDLDHETIARGTVTYARLSEDVQVRLVIHRRGHPPVQELARFVGPPIPKAEDKDLAGSKAAKEKFLEESERLRQELRKESLRTRELERAVRRLETQIKAEQQD
jgi:proteasome lid subunit RPN8/RPN11